MLVPNYDYFFLLVCLLCSFLAVALLIKALSNMKSVAPCRVTSTHENIIGEGWFKDHLALCDIPCVSCVHPYFMATRWQIYTRQSITVDLYYTVESNLSHQSSQSAWQVHLQHIPFPISIQWVSPYAMSMPQFALILCSGTESSPCTCTCRVILCFLRCTPTVISAYPLSLAVAVVVQSATACVKSSWLLFIVYTRPPCCVQKHQDRSARAKSCLNSRGPFCVP